VSEALARLTHRFVPARVGASGTTLLLLHGTGGNETDLLPLGHSLAPEAALLSPRGNVLENGMPRFFRRIAEGVFDQEDLVRRTHELAEFLTAAEAEYAIERRRLIAVGFSNGANIAASLLLLHPDALAGAVLFRAMLPFEPEAVSDLSATAVLLSNGRLDPIVPVEQPERLAALLREGGADATLHWERAGHELTEADVDVARAWLAQWEKHATP
jgi:phospholipase/carboxylesterase